MPPGPSQNDVREPTTQVRDTHSRSHIIVDTALRRTTFVLATSQEDHDWSSFVYWVVTSSCFAEQQNITSGTSIAMREVLLYGSALNRMFRDAILEGGSYGDMYEQNLNS